MSIDVGSKVVLALVLCCVQTAHGQIVTAPADREAALPGVIREVQGYGPPGYGEDKERDVRITYWVLDVPTPVNVPCTPERPEWKSIECKATKRIRLFFPTLPSNNGLELKARKMKGQKTLVTGVVRWQDTLGQMAPIYMNVTELQPLPPSHTADHGPNR